MVELQELLATAEDTVDNLTQERQTSLEHPNCHVVCDLGPFCGSSADQVSC